VGASARGPATPEPVESQETQGTGRARLIAGLLLLAALVATLVVALGGGDQYRVRAEFVSASQLVEGNLVRVAGDDVGTVESIELTDDGQALVTFTVDDHYAPLREGSRAIIRIQSLSGIANRYVDLQLGPADAPDVPNGGRIPSARTEAAVEVDQLFNVFTPPTREDTQRTIRLLSEFNAGRADEAQAALEYLSPSLAASSRLFEELSANDTMLERFVVETSQLVTDLAARDEDLAGLIRNLATTSSALAAQRADLGDSVRRLPPFLRRANSTFVNLRGALDSLDPLVEAAKPVARDDLPRLLGELRPFARDAVPTVRDLSRTIRRRGGDNDLVELLLAQPAVDRIANQRAERNGAERPGAFPEMRAALEGVTPQLAFFRPYTVDLVGWFDDFSTSGGYDALGSFSRAGLQLNAFTFTGAAGELAPVPPELRADEGLAAAQGLRTGRNNRCPGSIERPAPDGSNPYIPSPDFNCDPSQVPIGP
jgi:phospholipid/cholesterol/gamma-HCH transport system substrate-binding protein